MTASRGYEAIEDPALVALVVEGDGAALAALYERYAPVGYALARRMLGDPTGAAAVVRDVFVTVWEEARQADATRGGLSVWLLTLTHQRAVDAVRRDERLRRRRTAEDALRFGDGGDRGGGDDGGWGGLRRDRVRAALAELPEPLREALALAYFGGYTQREIAKLTDTAVATVQTRLLAALRRLGEALDAEVDAGEAARWRRR